MRLAGTWKHVADRAFLLRLSLPLLLSMFACLDAAAAGAEPPRVDAGETLQAEMAGHLRTEGLAGAV